MNLNKKQNFLNFYKDGKCMKKILCLLFMFSTHTEQIIHANEFLKQEKSIDNNELNDIVESIKILYMQTLKNELSLEEAKGTLDENKQEMLEELEFRFDQEKWLLEEIIFNLQKEKFTRTQIYQKIKDLPHLTLVVRSTLLINKSEVKDLTEDEFIYQVGLRVNFYTVYKHIDEIHSIFLDVYTKNIKKSRETQLNIGLKKLLPIAKKIYKEFDENDKN